jgi:hypothetical protein
VQQYLGPLIVAQRNRPVRVLFENLLPTSGTLDLNGVDLSRSFIPVDKTYMGAGNGPDGAPYNENRAVIHMHGGVTQQTTFGSNLDELRPCGRRIGPSPIPGVGGWPTCRPGSFTCRNQLDLTWAPTPAQARIANSFSLVAQAGTATAH